MNFSSFFIRRPVFSVVISLLIILIGFISLSNLPLRQFPDIERSEISIDTRYAGAAASTVETKITEIIENQISGIEGIKNISSVSRDGKSKVTIEFNLEKNIDEAANDVRDTIARITGRLPKDSDSPEIYKIDSDADAVMWLNLTSTEISQMELTEYAQKYLVDRLSVVPGVAKVRISGEKRKSMRIWLNPNLLSFYDLTVLDIEKKILEENIDIPAGRLESRTRDFTVKLNSGLNSVNDFKKLVIKKGPNNSFVVLQDVANVELSPEEPRQIFKGNGEEMIGLGIIKQNSANLIKVTSGVKNEFKNIQDSLPRSIKIYQSYDTSIFVSEALNEVIFTLCFAIILVTLVILFFLKNIKISIIPFLTVPISLLASFIFLNFFGFSINLITLLALVLCTGLVVDDSIVMLENIYNKIEKGMSVVSAAIEGSKEVLFAIISTSVVLASVFMPIIFLSGDTAKLFEELAVACIGAIFFSTIISLTLTPMLCSKILKSPNEKNIKKSTGYFKTIYTRSIHNIVETNKPNKLILLIFFFLILISSFLFYKISKELSPKEDRGAFFLIINGPEGSSYENTVEQMIELEEKLLKLNKNNEANRVLLRVPRSFSGSENFSDGIGIIVLNHWSERRSIWKIIDEIKKETSNMSDSKIIIFPPRSLGQRRSGSQLQFVIGGNSYDEIENYISIILKEIKKNKNFVFVDTDYKKTRPQVQLDINRKRSSELQVSSEEIGRTLEILLGGRKINTFISNGEEYYTILQASDSKRTTPDDISNIKVRSKNGELIRLDTLVEVGEEATAKELNRFNKIRAITIKAGLDKGYSLNEAILFLEKVVKENFSKKINYDYKGQGKEFKESNKQFNFLFLISFLIIYLVLAAQFESFISPTIIILTVPLSLSGGLIGLYICNSSLNIFSQIGMIILMGISAKNSILIVEFANQLRKKGNTINEALKKACDKRYRPIIMTGISTMISSLPLILNSGAGSESRLTIGIVIFFGLIFSIFLTLFMTPFFYKKIAKYSN